MYVGCVCVCVISALKEGMSLAMPSLLCWGDAWQWRREKKKTQEASTKQKQGEDIKELVEGGGEDSHVLYACFEFLPCWCLPAHYSLQRVRWFKSGRHGPEAGTSKLALT